MATYPQRADISSRGPFNGVSYVSFAQGVYYVLAGVWPLIDLLSRAFQDVVRDAWLVGAASVFSIATGAVLILAGFRRRTPIAEIVLLGTATAAGLAIIDLSRTPASPTPGIYVLDASFHIAFIVLWIILWRRGRLWI